MNKKGSPSAGLPWLRNFSYYDFFFAVPFLAAPFFAGAFAGALAAGNAPFVMVNIKGSGVYSEMTPIMLMDEPTAGGLVIDFSMVTFMSLLLAAWLSSLTATSSVLVSGAAMTFTGILNRASPFFSFTWMACHTFSAASLLAGFLSRQERTSSQSLNESVPGSFCCTAWAARSHGVGARGMLATKSGGGAVCCPAAAMCWFQSSVLP